MVPANQRCIVGDVVARHLRQARQKLVAAKEGETLQSEPWTAGIVGQSIEARKIALQPELILERWAELMEERALQRVVRLMDGITAVDAGEALSVDILAVIAPRIETQEELVLRIELMIEAYGTKIGVLLEGSEAAVALKLVYQKCVARR